MRIRLLIAILTFVSLSACQRAIQPAENIDLMNYPETRKDTVVDHYFGKAIPDPYRWLENDTSKETGDWVDAQNTVTDHYFSQIPFRENIREKLTELWNYPKESAPTKVGRFFLYLKNDGLQNQGVWFIREGENGNEEILLDPNRLSDDGTAAISLLGFSTDKKYLSYSVAQSGSDWSNIYVMELATRKTLKDEIKWTKFSGAAWAGDGFYYSRYDAPSQGTELSAANTFQKVYFHRLGTSQEEDRLIFEDKTNPNLYFGAQVTEGEEYLVIYAYAGTSGNAVHAKALQSQGPVTKLISGYEHNHQVVDYHDGFLVLNTDLGAPNRRVVLVDPKNAAPEKWKTLIAESSLPLEYLQTGGRFLWATYLKDASTQVVQFDLKGRHIRDVKLPGIGTVSGFGGFKDDTSLYYTFSNFTSPGTIYHFSMENGESVLFKKSAFKLSTEGYETKQVFYTSKDGTKIPLFIVHKKGIQLDGNHPLYLYGYGGFQISLTPSFSLSRMLFLEKGGIYAQAGLRGGSEYGEAWHQAGMLDKKQNVFDDFIAAAEYLISEKYTNASKIAIAGGSNGGLLVGACMTQRPELFRAALPAVGVLDMLRYHKFTVGWGWAVEYGTSDQQDQFDYLLRYSPLHQLKKGVEYPATLITTADHDDRVVPAHSFKFAATLQAAYEGKRPQLIRIEKKAGHGAGKPTAKQIEEATDTWSFVFQELGMRW